MQGQEPLGIRGEPLSREVLSLEIREARDLLPAQLMSTCEPYVVMTVFDSSGRAIGTRKTNVLAGSLNPYWMERFEFQVTQWDKEGGYVELAVHDNRDGERLGYIRQPLFRISERGSMEGWFFLDRPRSTSAALYFRAHLEPFRSTVLGHAPDVTQAPIGSGISARQPAATAGIGLSGVGSTTPVTVESGLASPSGLPMGAAPATASPTLSSPGLTPMAATTAAAAGAVPRETGVSPLFVMRHMFWVLSNTYEVRDQQGLARYRLICNFGSKQLDDIRIADASGHEVGFIREEPSIVNRLYRMPTYLISVYGTTAKVKRKFLSINEPIYTLRPFNSQSIHAKGNFAHSEFSFYQFNTIIADVSRGLAPPGDQGLYGIRVAPTFSNPLLLLAATVAIERIQDVAGIRPVGDVYSDSRNTLMSRIKLGKKKKKTVVTPTATPVVAETTGLSTAATTASTAAVPTRAVPVAATATTTVPATPIVASSASIPTTSVRSTTGGSSVTTSAPGTSITYSPEGIPNTPVVKITTVGSGEAYTSYGTASPTLSSAAATTEFGVAQPRAEMAAIETLRQEELPVMQAERVDLGYPSGGATSTGSSLAGNANPLDKEHRIREVREGEPVSVPIFGAGQFD